MNRTESVGRSSRTRSASRMVLTSLLAVVVAFSILGPARSAHGQVSGGSYVHPVHCVMQPNQAGVLISPWLPWYTTQVAVRPWKLLNGVWAPMDAVPDRGGWQDWKWAYLAKNGKWYYQRFSTQEGTSTYSRTEMTVGLNASSQAVFPKGYTYYLEYWYLDYWTGLMKSVTTQACNMG